MANDQLAVNTIRVLAVSLRTSNPTSGTSHSAIGGKTAPATELCLQSWC